MKERPMMFNAEMVRAILDGRKTQTRRIMKNQPCESVVGGAVSVRNVDGGYQWFADDGDSCVFHCPIGAVGDRIWVRETFQGPLIPEEEFSEFIGAANPDKYESPAYCEYAADGGPRPEYVDADDNTRHGWRPAIHMPRWASRITLEITGVRVERLNEISQADAIAEGAPPSHPSIDSVSHQFGYPDFSRSWFGQTWQHIYGEESWQANPWVWVIEFKRIEGGAA